VVRGGWEALDVVCPAGTGHAITINSALTTITMNSGCTSNVIVSRTHRGVDALLADQLGVESERHHAVQLLGRQHRHTCGVSCLVMVFSVWRQHRCLGFGASIGTPAVFGVWESARWGVGCSVGEGCLVFFFILFITLKPRVER